MCTLTIHRTAWIAVLDQTTVTFRIGFHLGTLGLASDSREEVKVDSAISCVDAFDAARAVCLFALNFLQCYKPTTIGIDSTPSARTDAHQR